MKTNLIDKLCKVPGNEFALERLTKMLEEKGEMSPIAFVGAGVSARLFPTWLKLLEIIGNDLKHRGHDESNIDLIVSSCKTNPPVGADQLMEIPGTEAVFREVFNKSFLSINEAKKKFDYYHTQLLKICFKGYVTTNYDLCLNESRREEFPDLPISGFYCDYSERNLLAKWHSGDIFNTEIAPVLYAHGTIDHLDRIVLGEKAYKAAYAKDSTFYDVFKNFWIQQRLIIIGFSFKDPWIEYIAQSTLNKYIHEPKATTDTRHIAIIPLEEDGVKLEEKRKHFQTSFNAEVLFFPLTQGKNTNDEYSLFSELLCELAKDYPRRISQENIQQFRSFTIKHILQSIKDRGIIIEVSFKESCNSKPWVSNLNKVLESGTVTEPTNQGNLNDNKEKKQNRPQDEARLINIISGRSGDGKSIFVRYLAIAIAEGATKNFKNAELCNQFLGRNLPIFLDLSNLSDEELVSAKTKNNWIQVLHKNIGIDTTNSLSALNILNLDDQAVVIIDSFEEIFRPQPDQKFEDSETRIKRLSLFFEAIREITKESPIVVATRDFILDDIKALEKKKELIAYYEIVDLQKSDMDRIEASLKESKNQHETINSYIPISKRLSHVKMRINPLIIYLCVKLNKNDDTQWETQRKLFLDIIEFITHKLTRDLRDKIYRALYFIAQLSFETKSLTIKLNQYKGFLNDIGISELQFDGWLREGRGILLRDSEESVRFEHEQYRNMLVAQYLADTSSIEKIIKLMEKPMREPMLLPWITGFSRTFDAKKIVNTLIKKNQIIIGLHAANENKFIFGSSNERRKIINKTQEFIVDASITERIEILNILTNLAWPEATLLLIEVAFPFTFLHGQECRNLVASLDSWKGSSPEEFVSAQKHKVQCAYNLIASKDIDKLNYFMVGYGHGKPLGGAWLFSSMGITTKGLRLPKWNKSRFYTLTKWLDELLELPYLTIFFLVNTVFDNPKSPDQIKLLVLSLEIEKYRLDGFVLNKVDSDTIVDRVLEKLAEVNLKEAPAFILGLINAVWKNNSNYWSNNRKKELNIYRKIIQREYLLAVKEFLEKTEQNTEPPPDTTATLKLLKATLLKTEPSTTCEKTEKRTFLDSFIATQGSNIHKLKAKDSKGKWAYYFVFVEPELEVEFLESLKSEKTIDLEDYGVVIDSNYGEEPSKSVRRRLNQLYGFDV